jgi:PST family polysaccharide transporter
MTPPTAAPPPAGARQTSLSAAFWSGTQQVGERGTRWIVYLILARLVAPDAVGVVVLAGTFVEVAQVVMNQGLSAALVQREKLEPGHIDTVFWGLLAAATPLTLLCVVAAGPIAAALDTPVLTPVLRAHAIAIPLAAVDSVQEALFRRRFAFRMLALRGIAGQLVGGVTALALAAAGAGVWTLVAFALVPFVVGTAVLWILSPWRPGLDVSLARYRELLAFGGFTVGVNVVSIIQRRADHFLIGAVLGPAALGYYAMARQFIVAVTDPVERAINPVMWSTLCRLQDAPARLDRAIRGFATHVALLLMPAALGLAASAPVLLPLLLGEAWLPSIPVLQALGCLTAVMTLATASSTAILAVGASRGRALVELVRVSVSVTALLIGMRWGIGGVGWALVVAAVLLLPVQLGAAHTIVPLRIRPYLGGLAVPALGAAVMAVAVVALRIMLADRLAAPTLLTIMIAGGAVVYAVVVWLIDRDLAREALESLRQALRAPAAGGWLPDQR